MVIKAVLADGPGKITAKKSGTNWHIDIVDKNGKRVGDGIYNASFGLQDPTGLSENDIQKIERALKGKL